MANTKRLEELKKMLEEVERKQFECFIQIRELNDEIEKLENMTCMTEWEISEAEAIGMEVPIEELCKIFGTTLEEIVEA